MSNTGEVNGGGSLWAGFWDWLNTPYQGFSLETPEGLRQIAEVGLPNALMYQGLTTPPPAAAAPPGPYTRAGTIEASAAMQPSIEQSKQTWGEFFSTGPKTAALSPDVSMVGGVSPGMIALIAGGVLLLVVMIRR